MLVLSRKAGESVLIGSEITVTVLSVCGDRVTLGIDAPLRTLILRDELTEPDAGLVAAPEP